MSTLADNCCTIVPYFEIHEGQSDAFRELCERFVEATAKESGCLYYGFSFNGRQAHCREGYDNAEALLAHLDNVGDLLDEALQIADLKCLEIHGPALELKKLRTPLEQLNPEYFVLETGFRRQ